MRNFPVSLVGWAVLITLAGFDATAQKPKGSPEPQTESVVLDPPSGPLAKASQLTLTFPTPMVPAALTGYEAAFGGVNPFKCPLIFDPPIETKVRWATQTEAEIQFDASSSEVLRIPRRVKLRPDLRDLAGRAVNPAGWGAQFEDEEFVVSSVAFHDAGAAIATDRILETALSVRPRVRLEFTRDVDPALIARRVYFQDYETDERRKVEVIYEPGQPDRPQGWMWVEPIEPLPVGRTFLLVIDRLAVARNHGAEKLPHLRVLPAGTTHAPEYQRTVGLHQPGVAPFARVVFDRGLDPAGDPLKFLKIEPPVPELAATVEGVNVKLTGRFDIKQRYRVTVKPGLLSDEGFPLPKEHSSTFSFREKRPAVILPHQDLYQRMSADVRVPFTQVNTGELTWQIAELPPEKLPKVAARVREFFVRDPGRVDPKTGESIYPATELLVPEFGLKVVGQDRFPASGGDLETPREIVWKPAPGRRAALYLLEIHGRTADGRTAGNRSIISCSDWIITRRESQGGSVVRVRSMADGRPVPGVQVRVLDDDGETLDEAKADAQGEARLKESFGSQRAGREEGEDREDREDRKGGGTKWLIVGDSRGWCRQKIDLPLFPGQPRSRTGDDDLENFKDEDEPAERKNWKVLLMTDRNVYRPGDVVSFKGFVREMVGDTVRLPKRTGQRLEVEGATAEGEEPLRVTLRPDGSFSGKFKLPADATPDEEEEGGHLVRVAGGSASFKVAEIQPPNLDVFCTPVPSTDGHARLRVQSNFFHGAANASARVQWRATWIADTWSDSYPLLGPEQMHTFGRGTLILTDDQPPDPSRGLSPEVSRERAKAGWDTTQPDRLVGASGEKHDTASLNAEGFVELDCSSPFPAQPPIARARIIWSVDVFSPTRSEAVRRVVEQKVQHPPHILGTRIEQLDHQLVRVLLGAFDRDDQPAAGVAARAEVFRLSFKTTKEQMGDGKKGFRHFRYRNAPVMKSVWSADLITPAQRSVPVEEGGTYVVRVTAPGQPAVPAASHVVFVDGRNVVEVAIDDDSSLSVRPERQSYGDDETAQLLIEAPFAGVVTVTVETDEKLDEWTTPIAGNAVRLPVKLKPSYAPNAFVTVHLVKPADAGGLAAERFGICQLHVDALQRHLKVETTLRDSVLEPNTQVQGEVRVTAAGAPVEGADVLVYGVSEAYLQLGKWEMPGIFGHYYPNRYHGFRTHIALGDLWNPAAPRSLSQFEKGFIIGAGPEEKSALQVRTDLEPLIFWEPHLKTGKDGRAQWTFSTRGALTAYRLVAVAQAGADRFGESDRRFTVSRPLSIEVTPPAFAREGDEMELRALVRQTYAETENVTVNLTADGPLEIVEGGPQAFTLKRMIPGVAAFRVRVPVGAAGQRSRLTFQVQAPAPGKFADRYATTLQLEAPACERTEVKAGALAAAIPSMAATLPPGWRDTAQRCDLLVSNSAWLPKLAGMKTIFERGVSLEQISTRLLGAALLEPLLAYVPAESYLTREGTRFVTLADRAARDFERLKKAQLHETGGLPFWEKGELHLPTTIQAAWATSLWHDRGIPLADEIWEGLASTLADALARRSPDPEQPTAPAVPAALRAFALFVVAEHAAKSPPENVEPLRAAAAELYEQRNELTDPEARAFLALALHRLRILPEQKAELLKSLRAPVGERAFDPETLSSQKRAEAIRLYAQLECAGSNLAPADLESTGAALRGLLDSSAVLSHQENLWALLAFRALLAAERPAPLDATRFQPVPSVTSPNRLTVGWMAEPLATFAERFAQPWPAPSPASYYARAQVRVPVAASTGAGGLRIDRTVATEQPSPRNGSREAPFELGELVLITYRIKTDVPQSYIRVVDELSAALETLNTEMPLIAEHYRLPADNKGADALLDHKIIDRARIRLYFDELPPGEHRYTILARARAAGQTQWPATLVEAVYDARFTAYSTPTRLWIAPPASK